MAEERLAKLEAAAQQNQGSSGREDLLQSLTELRKKLVGAKAEQEAEKQKLIDENKKPRDQQGHRLKREKQKKCKKKKSTRRRRRKEKQRRASSRSTIRREEAIACTAEAQQDQQQQQPAEEEEERATCWECRILFTRFVTKSRRNAGSSGTFHVSYMDH